MSKIYRGKTKGENVMKNGTNKSKSKKIKILALLILILVTVLVIAFLAFRSDEE